MLKTPAYLMKACLKPFPLDGSWSLVMSDAAEISFVRPVIVDVGGDWNLEPAETEPWVLQARIQMG